MAALAASFGSHLLAGLLIGNMGARSVQAGVALPIALVVTQTTAKPEPAPKPAAKAVKPRPKPIPRPVRSLARRPPVESPATKVPSAESLPENEVLQAVETRQEPTVEHDVPASEVDLGQATPEGSRLSLVLRADRLRGTDFAESVIKILEPMPDYRTLVSGTEISLVDTFDVLIIATPDPRDVTATFLAARAAEPLETVRTLLAGKPDQPRVAWSPVAGGMLGKRTRSGRFWIGDPRVLLSVRQHWLLLSRPEHVDLLTAPPAAAPPASPPDAPSPEFFASVAATPAVAEPPWLNHLEAVARQTGVNDEQGPALVIGFAGAGEVLSVPSVGPVRVPDVVTLAITAKEGALVVEGTAVFQNQAQAATFVRAAQQGKAQAKSSIAMRFLLRQMNLTSAIASLSLQQQSHRVTIRAVLLADDTQRILILAAGWSRDWFETRKRLSRSSRK